MLRWCHRLCAAGDQWGGYASKNISYDGKVKITRKKRINSGGRKWYLEKSKENNNSPGESSTRRETVGRAGMVPRRALEKSRDPPTAEKKETRKQAFTSLTSHRPEARNHRLPHGRHAALTRLPQLPRPRSGAEAERLIRHAAGSARRPCRGACDHCGMPQKSCCCCCCHSCSCEAAVGQRERRCTDARALHALCDAQSARGRARTAPDKLMLSTAHTHTTHPSCCTWGCTAAAWAGRALPGWRGRHTAPSSRWETSVPAHARPAAHHPSARPTQAPHLRCVCAYLRSKAKRQERNGESNGGRRSRGEGECPPLEEDEGEPSLRGGTRRRRARRQQGERREGTTLPLHPPPMVQPHKEEPLKKAPEEERMHSPRRSGCAVEGSGGGSRARRRGAVHKGAGGGGLPPPQIPAG